MFREALLDSSPLAHQNKHWPMAIAFAVEILAASVAVLVPLVSTGVLPISRHIPLIAPLRSIAVARPSSPTGPADSNHQFRGTAVVPLADSPGAIRFGHALTGSTETANPQPGEITGQPTGISLGFGEDPNYARPKPAVRPIVISRFDEAQLLKKVDPVYPTYGDTGWNCRNSEIARDRGRGRLHPEPDRGKRSPHAGPSSIGRG